MGGKKSIGKHLFGVLLSPAKWWKIYSLQKNRKRQDRAQDDAQLKLYNQILPGDFLHYGYFENTNIEPVKMSIQDIYDAQLLYAQKLVELVPNTNNIIMDVGCGMGGLLPLLNKKSNQVIALTPDNNQVKHITTKYTNKVLHNKFEDLDAEPYKNKVQTIVTSESLQYLNLDIALPLINKLLVQGGTWVACDYFRIGAAHEKSGHNYNAFLQNLDKAGFTITYTKDITPNILPTIAYVHWWATQIGMPIKQFGIDKIKVKAPGIHYAVADILPQIDEKINKNINTVDPKIFSAEKQYLLMCIERK
jgi:cyclopropane fatty-acyl-phospholipid synthase-like methyltransferase